MNRVSNCSFCERNETEIGSFLPGMSNASICANCIKQSLHFPINADASANCAFCGGIQDEVPKLIRGKSASICSACVDSMLHPSVLTGSGLIVNPRTRLGSFLLNSKNRFIRKYLLGNEQ